MARQLVDMVYAEFPEVEPVRIVFVPVGEPGSSSTIIARAIRDVRPRPRVISMADVERLEPGTTSVIVFVDDFSGTGEQLAEWWANVEPLVRPKSTVVAVGLLVMNGRARERIEEFAEHALCIVELENGHNVIGQESGIFLDAEKTVLIDYCRRTGCPAKFRQGFGACGLLIAFRHGCPNNSLPILWYEGHRWRPLFRRSAL